MQYFKQNNNVVRVADEEASNYSPENNYEPSTVEEYDAQMASVEAVEPAPIEDVIVEPVSDVPTE